MTHRMQYEASGPVWFDVSVTPNLSLTRDSACILLACLTLGGAMIGTITAALGAWPVAVFMLISMLVFAGCLFWHAHKLTLYEQRICLTEKALLIETRTRPHKVHFRARLSPDWLKIERRNADDKGCEAIVLRAGSKKLEIGAVLSPPERASLADAIEAALRNRRSMQSLAA